MTDKPITTILQDESHIEKPPSKDLRYKALNFVKTLDNKQSTTHLPDTLLNLITEIIKPLFSTSHHKNLTSTGRKNRVNDPLPASINRFQSQILFDSDDSNRPLWKNGWTSSLLLYILTSYNKITDDVSRKKTLEAHFHLLVPAVLHQIDDVEISYKCSGCQCLKILCDNLRDVQSEMLRRSGLTDVFVDALRNDFSLLPTLTPEAESLMLFRELYPAYRSLVRARFLHVEVATARSTRDTSSKPTVNSNAKQDGQHTEAEEDLRLAYLTALLRHQTLHSLHHLSTGSGTGSTISIPLSTFLISQLAWIFTDMGIASVIHLQTVLPLLRNVLMDPFGTAAPDMLLASVRSLQVIVSVTWPRIREKWWREVLRGCVGCWVNVADEEGDINTKDQELVKALVEVKHELKVLACLLEDIVGEAFISAKQELVKEEGMLEQLFDGDIGRPPEMKSKTKPNTPAATQKSMIEEL
ncbi:hypothetical protein PMZ80_009364 [Knufia obscura]|uniref:Uncharacterized protein n=2 Tax=Knufia TaxID=430999 RepID=A0AAN8EP94_9EURO|nr:hypothetical protein PMZ80_009364 [Knufia obscura]KAK5955823.1 hypothetical protein OHC33_003464 [Knufia fluminis]